MLTRGLNRIMVIKHILNCFVFCPLLLMQACAQPASVARTVSLEEGLAFPGAEGFGRFTTGGRGGKVLIVSNLDDDGPGSFRAAADAKFPRIIVFAVSG